MTQPFQRFRRFFRELRRRNVYKVAVAYAVVAFVVAQAATLFFPALQFPAWTIDFVIVLTLLGFPIALVVAWAFEMTPEGVRRTPEAEPAEEGAAETGDDLSTGYRVLVGLGLAAAAVAGGWYLTGGGGEAEVTDRSIAVLPFENMGGEASAQFTRGVHDGLLTRLSNLSDLQVISRTSVMQYEETDRTVPEIARELDAGWVVEGAVQQAGGQVQVNAQLIRAPEDAHRWARTYRRELSTENLFAIQSELTKKIARSLEAQLSPEEKERVDRRPTGDLDAYRLYVQGRTRLDERTEAGMRQAVSYFRRAIGRDSAYALAWSGLADAWSLLASYRFGATDTLYPRAREAARRALEIEPDLAEAHASLGHLFQAQDRNGPAALRELREALELKPSYARAHHWLGLILLTLGRPEEGLSRLEQAAELDPMSAPIQAGLANAYHYVGRFEKAQSRARRAEQLAPGYVGGPFFLGVARTVMGRPSEAVEPLRRARDRARSGTMTSSGARAWLAVAHHRAGDTARARALLAEVEETGIPYPAAVAHAGSGSSDAAISALRRSDYFYLAVQDIRYNPVFDPLRGDPRFQKLLRRVNREWGLSPDGSLPDSVTVSSGAEADD